MVVVALLAVGLVGMHHLVVSACHHVAAHDGHVAAVTTGVPVQMVLDEPPATALTAIRTPSPEAPSGLLAAAATCLAILLMVVGLIMPGGPGRLRRLNLARVKERARTLLARGPAPPDLACLSVLRT